MRTRLVFCCAVAGFAVTTWVASPAPANAIAPTSVDSAAIDAQVESLLAMPAAERRDHLKSLAPEGRRGLWIALKRAQVERRGAQSKSAGVYSSGGFALDPGVAGSVSMPRAVGSIRYDSDFPTTGFGGGAIVGNRFDTHTGIPVLASGTVSTVVALVVPGPAQTTSSAGFVLEGPQTGGGGAMAIFSSFTVASGVIDTVSFTGIGASYTGSSFFVLFGDFANSYIPVFGTASTLGQGHHGVVGYTGGMGPNITGTFNFGNALNAFIRASGNIVPVELMKFDVE